MTDSLPLPTRPKFAAPAAAQVLGKKGEKRTAYTAKLARANAEGCEGTGQLRADLARL